MRYPKRDPIKNYFKLPNELYLLGLKPTGVAIYAYPMRIEDRETFECYASYKTIGKAVGVSPNTVRKYVSMLVEHGLITTEHTTVTLKDGTKRNGTLKYCIRPIQEALDLFYEHQMTIAENFVTGWCLAAGIAEELKDHRYSFEQENEENARQILQSKEET